MEYFHSVTLEKEKCRGCTNCIKRCPTNAIRVQNGKAKIVKERCIDCGECIRICQYHAKKAVTDPFEVINSYTYKIALPAPALYGQFKRAKHVNDILTALLEIGFDDVFEVAHGADVVTAATKKLLAEGKLEKPAISSACPAVLKLISMRFPSLIDHIVPLLSPMEVSARLAKKKAMKEKGLREDEIGVFFISPCAAKVTDVHSPIGHEKSAVDGVIAIQEVYKRMRSVIKELESPKELATASSFGVNWANIEGESGALKRENTIAVDGIEDVILVLEAIEDNRLKEVEFVELLACHGGCVGGPLVMENSFMARTYIRKLAKTLPPVKEVEKEDMQHASDWEDKKKITHRPIEHLSDNMLEAMRMMGEIEELSKRLPGIDCGACGAPSCRAFAEDVVKGFANETDCTFALRDRVRELAREMMELEAKMPPAFRTGEDHSEKEEDDQ